MFLAYPAFFAGSFVAYPLVLHGTTALPIGLTMIELRLLEYPLKYAGQNCEKQNLVTYVWPDEKQVKGIRDDSLAQLVK